VLKDHNNDVNVVAKSPIQGKFASGADSGELIVWSKNDEGAWTKEDNLQGHERNVLCIDFSSLERNF
jgi:WD40 repeat protein